MHHVAAKGTLDAEDVFTDEDDPTGSAAHEGLVEMVLSEQAEHAAADPATRVEGVVIGVLAGLGPSREPLVDFPMNRRGAPVPARSTVAVDERAVGHEVALMFEAGDPTRPVLIGLIHHADPPPAGALGTAADVEADGERVVVSAKRELVLRCGKASLTLTRAGKILLRGTYVLIRSSGVNRIQGGSVQIN